MRVWPGLQGLFTNLICSAILAASIVVHAHAQTENIVIDRNFSESEFRELLDRLSDQQIRDILISEFAASRISQKEQASSEGVLTNLRSSVEKLTKNASALIGRWPEFGNALAAVSSRLSDAGGIVYAGFALLLCVTAGLFVRHFWRRLAVQRQHTIAERNLEIGAYGSMSTIADATLILLIELSSSVAFAAVALATLYFVFEHPDIRLFVSSYIALATVVLLVRSVIGFMFPQQWPIYRLVAISDEATRLVHWVVISLSAMWMFESTTTDLMARLGAPAGTPDLMSFVFSIFWVIGMLAGAFLINRATSDLLPSREKTGFANALARNWALILSVTQVFVWVLFTSVALLTGDIDAVSRSVFLSILVFISSWTIYRILILYLRAQNLDEAIAAAIIRAARTALSVSGLLVVLAIWGVDPASLANGSTAERAVQALINVGLTALIGWAVWDFIRTFIDVRTAAEQPAQDDSNAAGDEGGVGASRSATLLPILRSFAFAVIGLTCLFTALSSLGVNVAPLVAGAGVVGLAIGFGAQTLVKDIVSGAFFLIDDAFRVGEYIEIGETVGTVEKISIRSLQLRHHNGPVHTIPFGEIPKLTNNSRDWVIMKLRFTVPFGTDVNKIKKLFKQIGAEMLEADYAEDLIQTFKSQGVYDVDDVGMVIRGKFMAKPGKQWVIRKDVYARVQRKLEENGIEFARREVRVQFPDTGNTDELTDEHRKLIGAAAAQADPGKDASKAEAADTP